MGFFISAEIQVDFDTNGFNMYQQQTQTGSCQKFIPFDYSRTLSGLSEPISMRIFKNSNFTHFWVNDDDIVDGKPNGFCAGETQFFYDAPVQRLSNIFTPSQPSSYCQQILITALAYTQFKKCDPTIDINGQYNTKQQHKVCDWVCQLMTTELDSICTPDDYIFMADHGIDLHNIKATFPSFDCTNTDIWSSDEKCISPHTIDEGPATTQCVRYDPTLGGFCSSVYTDGTLITLPPLMTQLDLELLLPPHELLLALPTADSTCAMAQVKLYCQAIFPTCQQSGVFYIPTDANGNLLSALGRRTDRVLQSKPSAIACQEFDTACANAPLFTSLASKGFNGIPDCKGSYDYHYNQCFPKPAQAGGEMPPVRNLTASNARRDQRTDTFKMNFDEIRYQNNNFNNHHNNTIHHLNEDYNEELFHLQQEQDVHIYTERQASIVNYTHETYSFNTITYLQKYQTELILVPLPPLNKGFVVLTQLTPSIDFATNLAAINMPSSCPPPLRMPEFIPVTSSIPTPNNIYEGRCTADVCPGLHYTNRDRDTIEITSLTLIIISLICSILLSLSFIIFKSQRHKTLQFWFTLSYTIMIITIFISLVNRHGSKSLYATQCTSPVSIQHGEGWSFAQAFLTLYFLIATSCWWLCQSLDLYLRLIRGRVYVYGSDQQKQRNIVMHLFSWITPLLCVIPLAIALQLGYDGYLPFAWVSIDPDVTSQPIPLMYIFICASMMVIFIVGMILSIIIAYYLIRHGKSQTNNLRKFANQIDGGGSFLFKLKSIAKLFGFTMLMVFLFIMIIYHQTSVARNLPIWQETIREWAEDYLIGGVYNNSVLPPQTTNPTEVLVFVAALASVGIFMFILFFILGDLFGLYCGLLYFKCGLTVFRSIAKEDTDTNTDSGRSSSAQSSDGSNSNHSNKTKLSNDIFGGQMVLKQAKSVTIQSATESEAANSNTNTYQHMNSPQTSTSAQFQNNRSHGDDHSEPPPTKRSQASQQSKRKSLFKGFKNSAVLGNTGSTPISPNPTTISEHDNSDDESDIDYDVSTNPTSRTGFNPNNNNVSSGALPSSNSSNNLSLNVSNNNINTNVYTESPTQKHTFIELAPLSTPSEINSPQTQLSTIQLIPSPTSGQSTSSPNSNLHRHIEQNEDVFEDEIGDDSL